MYTFVYTYIFIYPKSVCVCRTHVHPRRHRHRLSAAIYQVRAVFRGVPCPRSDRPPNDRSGPYVCVCLCGSSPVCVRARMGVCATAVSIGNGIASKSSVSVSLLFGLVSFSWLVGISGRRTTENGKSRAALSGERELRARFLSTFLLHSTFRSVQMQVSESFSCVSDGESPESGGVSESA